MVLMARSVGIPARLARGYSGGERVSRNEFRVRDAQKHAWAELFFPGFGWQVFEATPSVRSVIRPGGYEPGGPPVASERATPSAEATVPPQLSQESGGGAGGVTDGWIPPALAGGAAALAAVLGLLAIRRRHAGDCYGTGDAGRSPARLWGRLTHDAARFGLAPEPNQTPYEFAGAVERVLPGIGPDVRLLAAAYVAEAYAGPKRLPTRAGDLSNAWHRVKSSLRRAHIARLVRRASRR
jgi:hypothetical protein